MGKFCSNCGKEVKEDQDVCLNCGKALKGKINNSSKSKVIAGLLALFFGTFGVHNFYLGYNSKGATQLVLTLVGYVLMIVLIGFVLVAIVGIWSFVEAIMLFTGSIHTDGQGRELE